MLLLTRRKGRTGNWRVAGINHRKLTPEVSRLGFSCISIIKPMHRNNPLRRAISSRSEKKPSIKYIKLGNLKFDNEMVLSLF
jgi:hypothetical protein